jgi:predicted nucleic acid-binding protein
LTGYVIDASAMGPLIIPDEHDELISILPQILASDDALVPQHWRLEVANLARMAVRKKRLTEKLLVEAFNALSIFDIVLDPHTDTYAWDKSLRLAAQHDLSAYDAAYLELAIRSKRIFVTKDKALIRAAHSEKVETLSQ